MKALTKGDLSSLRWIQAPLEDFPIGSNPPRETCSVYYASLNFRDIMLATGKLSADSIPGMLSIVQVKHVHFSTIGQYKVFGRCSYLSTELVSNIILNYSFTRVT